MLKVTLSTINHKNLFNYCTLLYTIVKNMVYLRIKILVSGANLPFYNFKSIHNYQTIPNYIIPINNGKRKKKGKKDFFCMIHINKKRKEREKSFLFCLYDSAINIHVFMLGN